MELNECKKCGTVGWTLDELKSGECPHCSALANADTGEGQLTIPDVSVAKRTVCKPCNGTVGNSGLGIAYFKCVHCNGTSLQTER